MTTLTIAEQLAATAAGSWQRAAAVWLLIEHQHWLPELSRQGLIDTEGYDDGYAAIDFEEAGCRASANQLIGTGSELQVLHIACALATTGSTPLFDLSSLDEGNRRSVLYAIAWASGGQEWAKSLGLIRGMRCGQCSRNLRGLDGNAAITHMRTHQPNVD